MGKERIAAIKDMGDSVDLMWSYSYIGISPLIFSYILSVNLSIGCCLLETKRQFKGKRTPTYS